MRNFYDRYAAVILFMGFNDFFLLLLAEIKFSLVFLEAQGWPLINFIIQT